MQPLLSHQSKKLDVAQNPWRWSKSHENPISCQWWQMACDVQNSPMASQLGWSLASMAL
jgi:hypothetical protein